MVKLSAQAAAQGSAVPNPFMADFSVPQTGNTASSIGLFDQSSLGHNDGQQEGGDLFSAGVQADLFGGDTAVNKCDIGEMDLQNNLQSGIHVTGINVKTTATPPPRPPPPTAASNGTPRAVSPSIISNASANKSAFDDLNDSIRMALGGSPSRPSAAAQETPHVQQQQQQQQQLLTQQQGFGVFDVSGNVQAVSGQPVVGTVPGYVSQLTYGYGSPQKQPIAGDGN